MSALTVMSFNIWRGGGRSLPRTIDAIRVAGADIVGLQECPGAIADEIAQALDMAMATDDGGLAILSRRPITSTVGRTVQTWGGLGVTVDLGDGREAAFFDAHLHWDRYGPYFLYEGKPASFVLGEEHIMRMPGLVELLDLMMPHLRADAPCFLVGDFNAPSHLDYEAIAWPTSLACHARGLADAYREVHPEGRRFPEPFAFDAPGVTWTPIVEEEVREVFDRIDFVYYSRRSKIRPTRAVTLDGRNGPSPWPSDHRAVVATFDLRPLDPTV